MADHILENGSLRAAVSDHGAELLSVWDLETQTERIWTGDPSIWNRHAPILFPFVGKVTGGKYRIGSREYPMTTQHGFARDMDFVCTEETGDSVTHCLTATEQTKAIYPFDFRLTVRHRLLADRTLLVSWTVENSGTEQMYYSIGGHPGFLLPQGVRKEDCQILFPGKTELHYLSANGSGFLLPRLRTLCPREGRAPWQADIPDTWVFEDHQVGAVGIALPDGKPYVMMECAQFPMLAVWANPAGSFICLEPWFGRTDDDGFTGTVDLKKDIQTLAGGQKKDISYSIRFD